MMLLNRLLHRPIAVAMSVIALLAMGLVSLRYIPVSLMPDVDIPQITVQVSMPGYSAQEVERSAVTSLRGTLMQVDGLKDIRSESRMDVGTIRMSFEPGCDVDLLFLEVNEKVDRAMTFLPRELERPKIMKAAATEIPAFYLDVYQRGTQESDIRFAQFSNFVSSMVAKRIEQLPQVAMTDISGTVGTEIQCIPDEEKLRSLGLGVGDLENAIRKCDVTLGALSVVDGEYRYNIHFDAQILTAKDISNVYINHKGRQFQVKDVCRIVERVAPRNGYVRHNGHNAITLAVVKQNDAQMEDLQVQMEKLMWEMREDYPDLEFQLTRDQTRLLTFTIESLKSNLYLATLLACLVLFLFLKQWRMALLVILSIPISLVLTLLMFYVLGISLNIISLSGLILGVGMIVDNSIIVTDNMVQKWQGGATLKDAVIRGTTEVFTPMFSSVLTTCSIFLPLIFLSGTAGALFYDQAMGVTIALFSSLGVATLITPVWFYNIYKKKVAAFVAPRQKRETKGMAMYEKVMTWMLRHIRTVLCVFCLILPASVFIFFEIEKQRLPYIPQDDTLMSIDWNRGISAQENDSRITSLMTEVTDEVETYTSMSGTQQFLLSHTPDITAPEAIVYVKCKDENVLTKVKEHLALLIQSRYPRATCSFGEAGNVYGMMFSADEPDLEIHLQHEDGTRPSVAEARAFTDSLKVHFPNAGIVPVVTETNVRYVADMEWMTIHNVEYTTLYGRLKELLRKNSIFEISSGANAVPVIVDGGVHSSQLLMKTVQNRDGVDVPLSYLLRESCGEDYKQLTSGNVGAFYNVSVTELEQDAESMMRYVNRQLHKPSTAFTATFSGGYFSSRQMIRELAVVLAVALVLLYFILTAQFESFIQPFIILLEMVVDVFFVVLVLWLLGETLNVMSMIGLVVMSGIIINDSILKVETINRMRRKGFGLLRAILLAGKSRLRPIVMTSLTSILALMPFLSRSDMGTALQYPLSLVLIIGMTVGTLVSLFFVPVLYYVIYAHKR